MQTTSQKWKELFSQIGHRTEIRAVIAGVTYDADAIYNVKQERGLFPEDTPEAGACVSSKLTLSVVPKGAVPRMADIVLSVRLVSADGSDASEWIPAGTYFIDTRSKERDGTAFAFTAYDPMLKAEQVYLDNTTITTWPQSDVNVVADIAAKLGVTVDPRTELAGYGVTYPNDLTMREVLGYIAASYAGNWTITPDNKLRLVRLGKDVTALGKNYETGIIFGDAVIVLSTGYDYDMNRSVLGADDENGILFGDTAVVLQPDILRGNMGSNIRRNAQAFKNKGRLEAYSGVKIWWSREDTYEEEDDGEGGTTRTATENAFEAGDNAGRVLELDCPWATQAMANAILEEIEGYSYQGADVSAGEVDPAAELGDTVVCDGVVFDMAKYSVTYDGSYLPDLSAPAEEEIDHEYPYKSETQRELTRRVKLGETYFGFRTSREKGIEVVNIVDGNETTRMVLNSNVQAFYNADGSEALYFDPVAGKYKFVGDVTIIGGSLYIGENSDPDIDYNLTIDRNGNITTYGNVHLLGPETEIDAPSIYGGTYYNSDGSAYLEIGANMTFWGSSTSGVPLFRIYDDIGSANMQLYNTSVLTHHSSSGITNANGKWLYLGNSGGYTGNYADIVVQGDIADFVTEARVWEIIRSLRD